MLGLRNEEPSECQKTNDQLSRRACKGKSFAKRERENRFSLAEEKRTEQRFVLRLVCVSEKEIGLDFFFFFLYLVEQF